MIVACENGNLHVTERDIVVQTGEILRTAAGVATADGLRVVAGSDNNFVSQYDDGVLTWRYATRDRVREVMLAGDHCVAVSEDRFFYLLDAAGGLIRRFRFPHRALCVAPYPNVADNACYVVGCGDGSVYVLEATGGVVVRYSFPDRIRDVKVVDGVELVVACEDGNVYFAPVLSEFLDHQAPKHAKLIEDGLQGLREDPDGEDPTGVLALARLTIDVQVLLLTDFATWCETRHSAFALALLDSVEEAVRSQSRPLVSLIYARALVVLAQNVSVAAALSRMARLTQERSTTAYPLHALVVALLEPGAGARKPADPGRTRPILVDALVQGIRVEDEWLREELLRALADRGLLDSTPGGFVRLGAATGIDFVVLSDMVDDARRASPVAVKACGLVHAIDRLSSSRRPLAPDVDASERAPAFLEWEAGRSAVLSTTGHRDGTAALTRWVSSLGSGAFDEWVAPWLDGHCADLREGRARFLDVADLFWNECLRCNSLTTGSAFISALALREITKSLALRHDDAPSSPR